MPLFYHILSIPAKLLTCLNASPPAHWASGGAALGKCPTLQTSIGAAVQPQVVIKRANERELSRRTAETTDETGAATTCWAALYFPCSDKPDSATESIRSTTIILKE